VVGIIACVAALPVFAQENVVDVSSLEQTARLFFSPNNGTLVEGAPFDVSVFVDTQGSPINTIDLKIRFDPARLQVVKTFGGRSVVGLWLEQPSYSNTSGTITFSGTIPNGITSNGALIATISFKPILSGATSISIGETSQVLANDGLGSATRVTSDRARFDIVPLPPGSVRVFSETHPFRDRWYNNNSPTFAWEAEAGVSEYSLVFDDKPSTIPPNTETTTETVKGYEDIPDGVWYFHIKAKKRGVWGATTHYPIRVDKAPPATFKPTIDLLAAAVIQSRGLVSFFTTDALSGIDRYEVGVIAADAAPDTSAAYVEAQSPYQLPGYVNSKARVVVRAFDRAGNIQSGTVDISPSTTFARLTSNNQIILSVAFILALIILSSIFIFTKKHRQKLVATISNTAARHEGVLPQAAPAPSHIEHLLELPPPH
jgi:hypothetical protein